MKVFVKTLKGTNFPIEVNPEDQIADVKRKIEEAQGADVYPAAQQMLIHQGKVLKDGTTLEENNVLNNNFIVVMLSKTKSAGEGSTTSTAATTKAPERSIPPRPATPAVPPELPPVTSLQTSPLSGAAADITHTPFPVAGSETGVYDQAASTLVAGNHLEEAVQQILDMGGGTWDRDTVIRALRAAFNNPERAVEYLYSGIPEQADNPPVARAPASGQPAPAQQPAQTQVQAPSSGPNANPLDLFPQGLPNIGGNAGGAGNLDFLRNSQQFQALRTMVQANPQILQPMLQELGKQNPALVRMIQEHQADFLRLINEPVEGAEGDILERLAPGMQQTIQVTPEENETIERLQAIAGLDRAIVVQVFFACNKNEEQAANYLLDHMDEFED